MNLTPIKQIAFDAIYEKISWYGEKSGKYYHGERVAKLALTLRKYILPDKNTHDDIITVAAWFHDILNGEHDHSLAGAEKTKILLAGHCTEYETQETYDIIYRHDERIADRDSFSVYAKIHQDADFLDHLGSFGIWQLFLDVPRRGRNIIETIEDMKKWLTDLETKYEYVLNFDVSKKIYREKVKFFRLFTERFSVEGTGGLWGENDII